MQHKQSRPAFTGGGYISSPSRRFGPPTVGMAVSSRDVGSSAAYRVGDFMTKKGNLQVLKPSTTVHQALEVLVEKSLSGFLVIDDDWKLVGVVSDYDLLALHVISGVRVEEMNIFPDVNSSWKRFKEMQKLLSKTNGEVVADLMTPAPLVVREATNLESAARVLLETKLHRLPVVDCDGKLVGVITREDIVRAGLHIKRTHQS
ncbi:CBS domain-containing protein CBSX1, chloroplastic isoform X1 [Cucurbita pepo subsp. pepo]|uniref:CBS domain-containing protein CBSX1, chloroplastic isoform X1 n=1 Tax=Cucurbita pepo subsp. pepo TaxID=3664 RepID=UPI000C9D7E99|nr:CBS domain-containing protein CBSX1, chloroplastic isoform X1 [Cucurbita pepo subsp. pepo]